MIGFQLGKSTVRGGASYLIHHVVRVPGLVQTTLNFQLGSFITTVGAAEIGKYVCVRNFFIINLDWSCVGSIQCHNFVLLAADVKSNLLCF